MTVSVIAPKYKTNFQDLLNLVNKLRQLLENHISRSQNQSALAESERQLASELVANEIIPSALKRLCTIFNLSPFERDILLLCVGMELDPNFELLCADAQGNRERCC